eukprot:m.151324 g.151324  ORF g.151324 m.151324 type:complete len:261 (-) comp17855_c1_seq18:160-942(-)
MHRFCFGQVSMIRRIDSPAYAMCANRKYSFQFSETLAVTISLITPMNQLSISLTDTYFSKVTQQLLEFPEPDGDQYVARVVGPAGNNLHRVTRENGEESLCSMPNKFRKNIWIKRGDYVLVDPIVEGNKVTSEISRILLKEHIRHLKLRELWPSAFTDTDDGDELDSSNDTVTGGDGTNAGTSAPVEETAVATSGVAHLCIDSRSTDAVATDEFGNAEYGSTDDEPDELAYLDDVPANTNRRVQEISSSEDEYSTDGTDD